MERDRDRRYDDRDRNSGGETYRPSHRPGRSPPPRTDNFRSNRSPPRRARSPPPVDTYIPPGNRVAGRSRSRSPGNYRRRSRSPTFRARDNPGSFRGRPRSPARRFSPRREERPRSPIRRRSRSPYGDREGPSTRGGRARSPPLKRGREISPIEDRRYRSPPPNKRERLASPPRTRYERRQSPAPRRAYSPPRDSRRTPPAGPRVSNRQRSRTPPRSEARVDPYAVASWRRRSLSPAPRRSEHASGRESVATSRRSSPPIHPDRLALAGPDIRSPAYENSRAAPQSYAAPSPPAYHGRSPRRERDQSPPRRGYSPDPMSPREPSRYRSPSPRRDSPQVYERDEPRNGAGHDTWSSNQIMAGSGASYRNGSHYSSRAPPSGPAGGSRYNESSAMSPPAGPASAPLSMSAHNRPSSASLLSAPTRPRGGSGFGREYPRDNSYGGPHPRRGPPMPYQYNEPPSRHYDRPARDGIPTGPRSGHSGPPPYDSRPPFRSNNSSSTTYPRTQRFMHHVANVPAIVPGGKLLPSGLDPATERRLAQLEEDKKKLLDQIEEKQRAKRAGLRDWERLERESAREGLKSELAEGHLNRMTGEGGLGSAAF